MPILIVEDDELLGDAVLTALKQEGYEAQWARDGLAGERALLADHFDLVVLDLGLPHRDGLSLLHHLRARGVTTPVLILTARDTTSDRVQGLDAGADDYVIKPFDLDELLARVRALLRRGAGKTTRVLRHNDLLLDPDERRATLAGEPLELTPREFELLKMLLENVGRVLSRAQMEREVYGVHADVDSNAVEVHVHHLRKKLGNDFVETVRGVGYRVPRSK